MITAKQESVLLKKIKSLTELEFSALLTEMAEHIRKNNWEHIIDECFDIDDYSGEIEDLQGDNESMRDELDDFKSERREVLDILEGIENIDDDVQKEIDKAIEILS